jgi:RNA-directed DNA polymerase
MSTRVSPEFVAKLTSVLRHGPWRLAELQTRARYSFPDDRPLLEIIVASVSTQFVSRPSAKALADFLTSAIAAEPHDPGKRSVSVRARQMKARWAVPKIATSGKLAEWLGLSLGDLDWLADVKEWTTSRPETKLRHYIYHRLPRRRGRSRLLEIPKPRLKNLQRRILHEILDSIPPHDAAHGFRPSRSIVSYAQPHVGQRIVLRFDLREFFASVRVSRIRAIFRTAGYPRAVADLLSALCTTRTPDDVTTVEPRWRIRHLPQGGSTSPALANLAAYRLDLRLHALAQTLGARYTRYADDIAFSGDVRLERAAQRLQTLVAIIADEEGFELNFRKSRFMRQGVRQQIAGVVVNVRPNVRRATFDELKAILHNCVRHGPATQNRDSHADFRSVLLGRIGHVQTLNRARGEKLRAIFERIDWER